MPNYDEPPPLIDAARVRASGDAGSVTRKSMESESVAEDDFDHDEILDESVNEECEDEDEECETEDEEDDEEDEDEYDEDEEYEDDEEEGEDDESEYDSDEDDDEPDIKKPLYEYHRSDEDFKESDLEERKKRRFLIGTHSFMDLADPHLEDALIPADAGAEDENITTEEKARRGLKAEKQSYKDKCAELGVKPNPMVLASLRDLSMDLTGMGMNAKEIVAVCELLKTNTHVEFLSLAGNSAGEEGGLAIAELIANNETITSYNLASTEILEVFDVICLAISQSLCIMHLNFSKNELEDMDMPHIKKVLRECQLLRSLNLSMNYIKDDGLRQIGLGLKDNQSMELIDLSHNRLFGDKKAGIFFTACAQHPMLKVIILRRNFLGDEGGKGVARALGGNPKIEDLDVSFNLMDAAAASAIGRSLGRHKERELKTLYIELQRWRQESGAAILKPFANKNVQMPIELVDFGMMLDIHTAFIEARDKALKVHPDLKIIHGQTYGLDHAKGPDHRALVIRKADAVCKSFETPLVMLMEELAKEKKELTVKEFRKFIKQCNLYKDKTLSEAFEKVFEKSGTGHVDSVAILEAFDKEYPGLRVIPEPAEEEEEKPKAEKKKKKGKKGKGKGGKGKSKGKGAAKAAPKGKGSKGKGKKK